MIFHVAFSDGPWHGFSSFWAHDGCPVVMYLWRCKREHCGGHFSPNLNEISDVDLAGVAAYQLGTMEEGRAAYSCRDWPLQGWSSHTRQQRWEIRRG